MPKNYLRLELVIVFIIFPIILSIFRSRLKTLIIPILILFSIVCVIIFIKDPKISLKLVMERSNIRNNIGNVFLRFLLGSIILIVGIYIFDKNNLFILPRKNINLWLQIIIFYPFVSVYPQEIIFRAFIYHRYKCFFNNSTHFIIISSLLFGLVHIVYGNWLAPILSFLGGILFAQTYLKSHSSILCSIEHGLWGILVFTIGIGQYFISDAIK